MIMPNQSEFSLLASRNGDLKIAGKILVRHKARLWLHLMTLLAAIAIFNPHSAAADTLKTPDPSIAPIDVVRTQLEALMNNDTPEIDFGIKQTWAFAHPTNRENTGPYERFVGLIKNPSYAPLIDHVSHTVTEQNRAEAGNKSWVQFKVLMEDKNGDVLAFAWVVKKVFEGPYKDCWMTSGVSAPLPAGQGS